MTISGIKYGQTFKTLSFALLLSLSLVLRISQENNNTKKKKDRNLLLNLLPCIKKMTELDLSRGFLPIGKTQKAIIVGYNENGILKGERGAAKRRETRATSQ